MKRKSKFLYSSSIKLGAALGDWTQLNSKDLDQEYFDVSSINSTNFDKLSRKELKKSHLIHHKLANLIAKHLSKDMNIKIELHTIMVTQILYSDFINSINDNIFQADLSIGEQGSINIIFGSNLASMMIDRLTGGKGENTDKSNFNELEMTLLNEQLQEIIPLFTNSWKESLDISNSKLSLYSGQYKSDNRISYRETYIVFTIYLYFGDGELMRLMVAYPNDLIRNLLKQEQAVIQVISPEIKFKQETLDKVRYNVKAELGSIELPMKSLSGLTEGDVIPLNQSINTLIKLDIGNKIELYGQPCIYNNKVGAQVIVTEDYKNNVILSKKTEKKENQIKKVRLPIDKIVDQEKESKSPVFQLEDIEDKAVEPENLAEFLPENLSDNEKTLDTPISEKDVAEDMDGLNLEAAQEELDSDSQDDLTSDSELDQDVSEVDESTNVQNHNSDPENEDGLVSTDDKYLESQDEELAEAVVTTSETDDLLNEESDEIQNQNLETENDEFEDTQITETSLDESGNFELDDSHQEAEAVDVDDDLDSTEEVNTESENNSDKDSDNDEESKAESDEDLFDEELDFGDIEASLEDDSLDWDEADSPKLD